MRAALEAGSDPNTADAFGESALFKAASRGHSAAVGALLRGGAAPAAASLCGDTPLHAAAAAGSLESAALLVAAGANPAAANARGWQPLHVAAKSASADVAAALLLHGASATSADDDGATPLDLARLNSSPAALRAFSVLERALSSPAQPHNLLQPPAEGPAATRQPSGGVEAQAAALLATALLLLQESGEAGLRCCTAQGCICAARPLDG